MYSFCTGKMHDLGKSTMSLGYKRGKNRNNNLKTFRCVCKIGKSSIYLLILLTYLFTPWSRVLLETLTGPQLVRNSPNFMEPEGSLPHL